MKLLYVKDYIYDNNNYRTSYYKFTAISYLKSDTTNAW